MKNLAGPTLFWSYCFLALYVFKFSCLDHSLVYITCDFQRFLHRGWVELIMFRLDVGGCAINSGLCHIAQINRNFFSWLINSLKDNKLFLTNSTTSIYWLTCFNCQQNQIGLPGDMKKLLPSIMLLKKKLMHGNYVKHVYHNEIISYPRPVAPLFDRWSRIKEKVLTTIY